MPPEIRDTTRPLAPTGNPPALGILSKPKKASCGRISTVTVNSGCERSTRAPDFSLTAAPSCRLISGEAERKRRREKPRSEERRVGKEGRSRGGACYEEN